MHGFCLFAALSSRTAPVTKQPFNIYLLTDEGRKEGRKEVKKEEEKEIRHKSEKK